MSAPLCFIQHDDFTGERILQQKPARALGWFESISLLLGEKPGSGSWERSETRRLVYNSYLQPLNHQLDMKQGDRWWN